MFFFQLFGADGPGKSGRAVWGPGQAGRGSGAGSGGSRVGGLVRRVAGRGSRGRRPQAPFLFNFRGSAGRARDPRRTNNNNNKNNKKKNSDSKVPRSRSGTPPSL